MSGGEGAQALVEAALIARFTFARGTDRPFDQAFVVPAGAGQSLVHAGSPQVELGSLAGSLLQMLLLFQEVLLDGVVACARSFR